MAKRLNVNLAFTADTSQAKKNIQDLQTALNNITSMGNSGLKLTKDVQQAVESAKSLQMHLSNAFNVNTGNLDLTLLNKSLKSANTDLASLGSGLLKAGLQGEEAFMNVQRAIATANVQINQSNSLLGEMWTTLKNTARWQISSSILHGFMGAIQSAYGYAQDLDESLNNIRIVTGQNIDQMAKFAEQANKAAKALSTTTTDYTNASLIYYQQGLSDQEVQERTDITIKMANAAGESAEKVSDQLTAVWNNFAKGGDNLEYYADVMTALGAATASSTDEISEGLNKFAAVAETVGLSYEYAASALATVTATTRQSADVVGTAFKTLFARIQDLELGKTLDDGTSLGKYSAALAAVGVNIKDANGGLKDMDQILNEMAAKWNTLNKDQQVSLAQTVAGVRQYTQLIALMDNWDFMEENLQTSYGAEGALQEQANIYAESWDAAQDRLRASMETLYDDLIPEQFIIKLTDAVSDVVDVVDILFNSFGGLETVLLLISNIVLTKMGPSITNGLNAGIEKVSSLNINLGSLIKGFFGVKQESSNLNAEIDKINGDGLNTAKKQIDYFEDELKSSSSESLKLSQSLNASALEAGNLTDAFSGYLKDTSQIYNLQGLIEKNADRLTTAERERLSIMQEQSLVLANEKKDLQTQLDILKEQRERLLSSGDSEVFLAEGYSDIEPSGDGDLGSSQIALESMSDTSKRILATWTQIIDDVVGMGLALNESGTAITGQYEGIAAGAREAAVIYGNILEINGKIHSALSAQGTTMGSVKEQIKEILAKAQEQGKITKETADRYTEILDTQQNEVVLKKLLLNLMTRLQNETRLVAQTYGNSAGFLENIEENAENILGVSNRLNNSQNAYNQQLEQTTNYLSTVVSKFSSIGGVLTTGFQGLSTVAMGISSISNAFKTLQDDSTGFGQKLTTVAMAGTMGIRGLVEAYRGLNFAIGFFKIIGNEAFVIKKKIANETIKDTLITELNTAAQEKNNRTEAISQVLIDLGIDKKKASALTESFLTIEKKKGTDAAVKETIANIGLSASFSTLLLTILPIIAAIGAMVLIWDAVTVSAKEASEQIKTAAEGYEEAKQEIDSLDSSLKSIQDRIKELENMDSLSLVEEEELQKLKEEESILQSQYDIQKAIYDLKREQLANEFIANSETVAKDMSKKAPNPKGTTFVDGQWKTADEIEKIINSEEERKLYGIGNEDIELWQTKVAKLKAQEAEARSEYQNENLDTYLAEKQGFFAVMDKAKEEGTLNFKDPFIQDSVKNIASMTKSLYGENYYDEKVLGGNTVQRALNESGISFDKIITDAYTKNSNISEEEIQNQVLEAIKNNPDLMMDLYKEGALESDVARYQTEKINKQYEDVSEKTNLSAVMSDKRWSDGDLGYLAQIKELERYKDITSEDIDKLNSLFKELDQLKRPTIDAQGSADAKAFGLDVEEFETYRELLRETTDVYDDNSKGLNQVAIANKRMEKGVKELAGDWEDLNEVLSDENAELEDVSTALAKVKGPLQNILNLSDEQFELLPESFAKDNWNLIQDVINGVEGSVDELRNKAGESILLNIGAKIDTDGDGSIDAAFMELHNEIASYDNIEDFKVGVEIDPIKHAEFIASCNELINAAGMTAEQAKAYFASMGYDVELKKVNVDPETHPWHIDNPLLDEVASEKAGVPIFKGTEPIDGTNTSGGGEALAVKVITPNGSYGGGIGVKTTAPGGARKSSSGGGSSKSKKAEKVKKTDVVKRYKEINDQLEETQNIMDETSKIADTLWGEARFKKMRENIKLLKDENKLLEEKSRLADAYLVEDKRALESAAAKAGLSFTFDPTTGNITNYTKEMTDLYNRQAALINKVNADGNVTEAEQKRLDTMEKRVNAVKDAIDQYEETLDEKQKIDEEHLDNQIELWNQNFELLNEQLELKISINEGDLEIIDYYLSKMDGDFYSMAEAYAKMSEQGDIYNQMLADQKAYVESLDAAELGEANYKQALEESRDATIDNLNSLLELDKEMMEYYGDTLNAANDELSIYTDKMEYLTSVLDHYSSVMELLGKSQDYKMMGTILKGQAETVRNELEVAQRTYALYDAEAKHWKEQMDNSIEGSDAWEVYKKNWDAAQTAANDAQDQMLSKTEEWVEAMKATIENELSDIGQTLEKSITGGTSFDDLLSSMERANSLQEEYLTDTNQIYETNKLIRTAQQEIDKTQNTVAKRRLQAFINETEQLQDQSKLSQYELEIQQAKYDLLLAEIALEEAQQAKSTVRLTRDAEGNFGYVYTADQNQISQAQQELEDAQNNLYNIGLEGANDYGQKYAETMQEMYDTLAEIQQQFLDGEIATQEEYDAKMLAAKEYYFNKLKDFSNLYQVALTTDSRVVNDAWSSDFNDMIYKTEELQAAVNDYADKSAGKLQEWSQTVKTAMDESGLVDINTVVEDLVDNSEDLTKTLLGDGDKPGVIDAIEEEIHAVNELSGEYASLREQITGLISDYEGLINEINEKYKAEEQESTKPEEIPTVEDPDEEKTPETPTKPSLKVGSAVSVKKGTYWYGDSWGGGSSGIARGGIIKHINKSGTHPYNIDGLGWVKKEDIVGFKTGGYTGSWGSYGKLGILDEKELILNQSDTANFLAGLEVLEHILQIIDLQTMNAQLGGLLSTPGYSNYSNSDVLEQNVHIEASFPGVQDRYELEEAFNNLINQASQYANRK